ncbi:MAG: tRNA (N(6)-L-threonylcarbamoyladenosine(37)-C(2))-methylthiotransferase MtaB [Syntrophorhabdaceae bacterium]|nr:tRNA (N(6)-L-threonylcarbamoyladenosine(37)-C(2))-methylthiotransferase MtaB [Syntrophorhabdaceae bacterium]
MRFYIKTTGCRANQWDTYVITNLLTDEGHIQCPLEDAEVCIINACTLTDGAERDIRRFINQCREKNPSSKIIISGCHGEVYPEKGYGADVIIGHKEKFNVSYYTGSKDNTLNLTDNSFLEKAYIKGVQTGKTRFFFKIQDGCDRFCSYCIVPYARGKPKSRDLKEILQAMETLSYIGIKEVVLTGIELSAYRDEKTNTDLKGLLNILELSITPPRIRLSSIDPLYISEGFINTIKNSKKVAKSIHISAQSFSNRILKLMKRNYTKEYLMDRIHKMIEQIDDIGIGLDIIVGFPTEDEDAFKETFDAIDSLQIHYLHVFPFSPREKTEAANLPHHVPLNIKRKRVEELRRLDRKKRLAFYEKYIGKHVTIIPEGKVYKGSLTKGYTENYMPVFVPYKKSIENTLIEVKIKGIKDGFLEGEYIK